MKKTALIGCVAIWGVTCALGETDKVNLISCPDCGQRVRKQGCPSDKMAY